MDQDLPPGVHSLRLVDDPLANWPKDAPLPIRLVEPGFASASAAPEKVAHWDYYDGAVVMVGVTDGETYTIEGSVGARAGKPLARAGAQRVANFLPRGAASSRRDVPRGSPCAEPARRLRPSALEGRAQTKRAGDWGCGWCRAASL